METVVTNFVENKGRNKQEHSQSEGETQYIYQGMEFVLSDIAQCKLEIVLKHA